ncbi:hypothetical protein [Natronorubrum sp. FCH18a]|uniref:hypothetical protein n=1 Tax=Natronorubrum sp. FCH18a TaxID=3447018 RepID=UPI003F5102F2
MHETESQTELTHAADATIVETAVALKCELLRRTCGPAQIEADTYRRSVDYPLKAAIRGWQDWTGETATQFVEDCINAACGDLKNNWFQALESIGHPVVDGAEAGR